MDVFVELGWIHEKPAFLEAFEAGLKRLTEFVKDFDREEHNRHAFFFRNQMWPFSSKVPVMERCLLQPRGYPGDSGLMKMMYDARYEGESMMAQMMHWHAVHSPAAAAVRNRRKLVADNAARVADSRGGATTRVLSVACGPAAELQNMLAPSASPRHYEFVLMDQDPLALQEAQESLVLAQTPGEKNIQAHRVQLSALDLVNGTHGAKELQSFDFIYSMGLFDYLSTDFAKQLAANLFSRLRPNGVLLLGNYHVSNPHKIYMQYWCDWTLVYRTEEEMLALLGDVDPAYIDVGFEPSNTQMFVRAQARAAGKTPAQS